MPEIRTINNDRKVATFVIASERNYKNKDNKYDTDFIPIVLYRSVDFVEKYIGKGDLVGITGSVQSRSYEKDGQKKTAYQVLAEEIQLLTKAGKKEDPKPQGMDDFDEIEEITLPF
jgi:single-strand DNA-binding protein